MTATRVTPDDLVKQLTVVLDPSLSVAVVGSYVEMQQRFMAGDWKPAELDGGRLCEAVARSLLQFDTGTISHSELPGSICDTLRNKKIPHNLQDKDRDHVCRVMGTIYKFRSDRGAVHISPVHTANAVDAMLVLHAGKWLFAELLRLTWNTDRRVVGEVIAQLAQLETSLVHELDGRPLVLARGISAPEEVLLLVSHAPNNRLSRAEIRELAPNQRPQTISTAISRLVSSKELRDAGNGDVALTPLGQKRLREEVLPKYSPR